MTTTNPLAQIVEDRAAARAGGDPLADLTFLATVTEEGGAAVRTLVLREIRDNRFTLFLNRSSPKWQQLTANGRYELLLYYHTLGRQYRLSGSIEEIAPELLAPHWRQRPAAARYLDHFYTEEVRQSRPVASRAWLLERIDAMRERQPSPDALETSASATGIECVVARIDRLDLAAGGIHERTLYTLEEGAWVARTLVP